jgi:SAM-dependent methyltransferase
MGTLPSRELYERPTLHDQWEATYRDDPLLNRADDALMDRVLSVLKPKPGSLFLDAGCGTGEHTIRLIKRGYRCVGVDISETILERAKIKSAAQGLDSATYVSAPLENLPFDDGHFDHIHCRGVLMHVPDWQTALTELCRVLKSGGGIVLMENNDRSIEHKLVQMIRKVRHNTSERRITDGGDEFWAVVDGHLFVVRVARVSRILSMLPGFELRAILPASLIGIGRVPSFCRPLAIQVNRMYLSAHMPWSYSEAVAIVAVKKPV